MLRLEKVNGANVWDILKLSVNDEQKDFVASPFIFGGDVK
ncbi:diamine N-acetyltransferase [Eubacterium oxidoreducens]|uniref:Diamine N-acetyltransferase n=1 Tax=Eubacterium oxidoreducens TaxID=1732 RepID=A0A1G6BXW4_EUBOX|nr:diamine N-acetyltransferase [Eubacterium oxidoreducens]